MAYPRYWKKSKQPKKEYDTEFFHLVLWIWFFILFCIFGSFFKLVFEYKYSQAVYYFLLVSFAINILTRITIIIEKRFAVSPIEKMVKEVEAKRKEKISRKKSSAVDPNQNPR